MKTILGRDACRSDVTTCVDAVRIVLKSWYQGNILFTFKRRHFVVELRSVTMCACICGNLKNRFIQRLGNILRNVEVTAKIAVDS